MGTILGSARTNIFKIQNPQNWWCRVSELSSAHTVMRIDVIHLHDEQTPHFSQQFALKFRKVAYFSGWMTWVGANFQVASDQEKVRFIRNFTSLPDNITDKDILGPYKFGALTLYIVETEEAKQVRILANAVSRLDKDAT